jgi:hypothetical protein
VENQIPLNTSHGSRKLESSLIGRKETLTGFIIFPYQFTKLTASLLQLKESWLIQSSMRAGELGSMFDQGFKNKFLGYLLAEGLGLETTEGKSDKVVRAQQLLNSGIKFQRKIVERVTFR